MTPRSRRQVGFTLIEILVALLIFSFGLLGFVGLQARAIQYSVGAEDSNRAALLANDIASIMVATNKVDTTNPDLATAITTWKSRVTTGPSALPNAAPTVVTTGNTATIRIEWRPPSMPSAAASNSYQTQVVLPVP